jgi:hypothetical protein
VHEHLSRELFRAIHKGWRNPGDLAAIAMAHLFELCPHCRSEFEAWRGELGEGVARGEGDYDGALQRIRERTAANDLGPDAEEARLGRERRDARSRAEALLALPDDQRLDWIQSEKDRHSGLLLAEALIEECRRRTPGYPHEGFLLANLSRVVLHHAPANDFALELFVRSLAYLGNASRVLGDTLRADQLLGDARYLLRVHPAGDRGTRAEIDCLVGSLRVEQFREDEAIAVLLRALMVYELERDDLRRVVTALLPTDRPGAADVARFRSGRVVLALSMSHADRVDRWQIDDIEAERGDFREAIGHVTEGAVHAGLLAL